MRRRLIISLMLAVVCGGGAGAAVVYNLPPFPLYGAESRGGGGYWMAGQVNPPGTCGFTFTAQGPAGYSPAALDAFTVQPEFGSGPGVVTSGGMMIENPIDAPAGSYVVVYGFPISSGWSCTDEQGRLYKPMLDFIVLRNPTVLPDPYLRRLLALTTTAATGLLVFSLSLPMYHRLARPDPAAGGS